VSAVTVFAIMASAMTVLLGLVYLTRGLFRIAVDIRDNKNATVRNTKALEDLAGHVDGRMDRIETWITSRDPKWQH
jgi:hypothetical protein